MPIGASQDQEPKKDPSASYRSQACWGDFAGVPIFLKTSIFQCLSALSEPCMVSSMLVKMLKARSTGNEPSMSTASSSMAFFPKKPAIQITHWKKGHSSSKPPVFVFYVNFPGRKLFCLDHKKKQITSIQSQTH